MSHNLRLKKIEQEFSREDLQFLDILKPGYVYKGKPFDDYGEMCRSLKLVELPPWTSIEQDLILLQKGILSHKSEEAERVRLEAGKQMKENM